MTYSPDFRTIGLTQREYKKQETKFNQLNDQLSTGKKFPDVYNASLEISHIAHINTHLKTQKTSLENIAQADTMFQFIHHNLETIESILQKMNKCAVMAADDLNNNNANYDLQFQSLKNQIDVIANIAWDGSVVMSLNTTSPYVVQTGDDYTKTLTLDMVAVDTISLNLSDIDISDPYNAQNAISRIHEALDSLSSAQIVCSNNIQQLKVEHESGLNTFYGLTAYRSESEDLEIVMGLDELSTVKNTLIITQSVITSQSQEKHKEIDMISSTLSKL